MPAQNAVAAALMVDCGFTGVADTFSGERSFFHTFSKDGNPNELGRELGKSFELLKNCSIKKWPVGAPILGPLDAMETLISNHGIVAADVEKVVVRIGENEAMIVNNRDMPDINLQHLVAVMLIDGVVTFKSSHDFKRMRDPKVVKLKERVQLIGAAELTDPNRRWHGEVTVYMRDGREFKHYTHAARGSAFNPMTREEEERKSLDLMIPVLGKQGSIKLIDALWNVDKVKNVRDLRKLLMK
jgi:2-methylcitrate dehydratase PrpD